MRSAPSSLFFLVAFAIAVVLAIIFTALKLAGTDAAMTLIGVLVGAGVSAYTTTLLAREERRFKLAKTAVERRLEVHQQAYSIWSTLVGKSGDSKLLGEAIDEADAWWKDNCLYLDAKVRMLFRECLMAAFDRSQYLGLPPSDEYTEVLRNAFDKVKSLGPALAEAVDLPSLKESEEPLRTKGSRTLVWPVRSHFGPGVSVKLVRLFLQVHRAMPNESLQRTPTAAAAHPPTQAAVWVR